MKEATMTRNPTEARSMILAGEAPEGLSVTGSLGLSGCTGLTALPEGLSVTGSLYVGAPAEFLSLAKGLTCRSIRPSEMDRGYWEELLDIDTDGLCWGEVYERFANEKRALLKRPGLKTWQKIVIKGFRG